MNNAKTVIEKFFEEHSFVRSNIESFNHFVEKELNSVLEENREVIPTIIPPNVDSFKIRLDKIWVTKPEITEADGSKRSIYPAELAKARFCRVDAALASVCFSDFWFGHPNFVKADLETVHVWRDDCRNHFTVFFKHGVKFFFDEMIEALNVGLDKAVFFKELLDDCFCVVHLKNLEFAHSTTRL